jgi:hypothetical protein
MREGLGISSGRVLAGLAVVVAAGAAGWFALAGGLGPRKVIAPPDDGARLRHTDPKLIAYEEIEGIPTGMNDPRGLALGWGDRIHVVGDSIVRVFDASGAKQQEFPTAGEGTSLGVAPTIGGGSAGPFGESYVATKNRVEIYDAGGHPISTWDAFDPNSMFSSIAVEGNDVFVADDNLAEVLRCGPDGKIVARIGRQDPGGVILLRSPHFDVALNGGLLWITNPGRLRVEAYTFEGKQVVSWGEPTMDIEGFSGCCNPKDIAFLPTGEVVTSEKGLPRVKVYSRSGKFLCVVAGPESFDPTVHYLDLAVDGKGRVLVLDPVQKKVRIFVRKKQV